VKRVIVTGSRSWTDRAAIEEVIKELPLGTVIIHGDCKTGADAIADEVARAYGLTVEKFPADWKTHGLKAGPLRNTEMVAKSNATEAHAFPLDNSRGTFDCMRKLDKAGIPLRIHLAK
jgi:hypothetical protein